MTLPGWVEKSRAKWRYRGQEWPAFAEMLGAGQESVWNYPRPPKIVPDSREVTVQADGVEIARSSQCLRVLETASPPAFYIPPAGVRMDYLEAASGSSLCEWKGNAAYWTVVIPGCRLEKAAWSYPHPFPEFEAIRGYFSFYPARLECFVDDVRVLPQPGRFYGGWVTPELAGPFKGEPGSENW